MVNYLSPFLDALTDSSGRQLDSIGELEGGLMISTKVMIVRERLARDPWPAKNSEQGAILNAHMENITRGHLDQWCRQGHEKGIIDSIIGRRFYAVSRGYAGITTIDGENGMCCCIAMGSATIVSRVNYHGSSFRSEDDSDMCMLSKVAGSFLPRISLFVSQAFYDVVMFWFAAIFVVPEHAYHTSTFTWRLRPYLSSLYQ